GIRYPLVTGVQTCALPISAFERGHPCARADREAGAGTLFQPVGGTVPDRLSSGRGAEKTRARRLAASVWPIAGWTKPIARVRRQGTFEHRRSTAHHIRRAAICLSEARNAVRPPVGVIT